MVVVIMRIQHKADGLGRGLPDFGQDFLCAPGVIGVNGHYVVFEYDPDAIGRFLLNFIAPIIENPRRQLAYDWGLAAKRRLQKNQQTNEEKSRRSKADRRRTEKDFLVHPDYNFRHWRIILCFAKALARVQ